MANAPHARHSSDRTQACQVCQVHSVCRVYVCVEYIPDFCILKIAKAASAPSRESSPEESLSHSLSSLTLEERERQVEIEAIKLENQLLILRTSATGY